MPSIVEIAMSTANLALEFGQMRTWLDHMRFRVIGFRQLPDTGICQVEFESEQEASRFAEAFRGQVLTRVERKADSTQAFV